MKHHLQELLLLVTFFKWSASSIAGLTYMDSMEQRHLDKKPKQDDPCNPLYWYPRQIPEHCYDKSSTPPPEKKEPQPIPVPIPVPAPPPVPIPYPAPLPIPVPIPPIPYGIPILPTNPLLPIAVPPYPLPYPGPFLPPFPPQPMPIQPLPQPFPPQPEPQPFYQQPYGQTFYGSQYSMAVQPPRPPRPLVGMVPGVPGIVSHDGGINILPFTDVYADMLEKHKQRMIRKEMEQIVALHNIRKGKKSKKHRH